MKRAFRYNRHEGTSSRPPCGYVRWLAFLLDALKQLLRIRRHGQRLVWTEDEAAELLAAGFPDLLAVPAPLFAETAPLFPKRCRLSAAGSEEELLGRIRLIEERFGLHFDWDGFLTACERQNRRASRLLALAEDMAALAALRIDARSPQTALKSLSERKERDEKNADRISRPHLADLARRLHERERACSRLAGQPGGCRTDE